MDLVPQIAASALLGPGRMGSSGLFTSLLGGRSLTVAAPLVRPASPRSASPGSAGGVGRRLGSLPLHRPGSRRSACPAAGSGRAVVDLAVDLLEHTIRQATAAAASRGSDGSSHGPVSRRPTQSREPSETQPILDRRLQAGVRQPMPLLQQQRLEHHHRRVARRRVARAMHRRQQPRDRRPVDQFTEPLQRSFRPFPATRLSAKLS